MAYTNIVRKMMMTSKTRDIITVVSFQLLMLVLYGIFVRYNNKEYESRIYPMFQDVHVMIFVGFGFLMTFLKRYGFSAVGFNFLFGALMLQWATLCQGFYQLDDRYKIELSIVSLLRADVATATVLISMGAVLGRTSYVQLLVMGMVEMAVYSLNSYLGSTIFRAVDAGDSIFVHAFGAYFGLSVSYVLNKKKRGSEVESTLEGSSYTSDLFAMIGTIFLWLFWPSFNSAELEGDDQQRAVINTYLSLTSCCVTTFAISAVFSDGHKFDMVHVQNSTLAGGVAIGAAAHLMVQPYGALIVGAVAAVLSVFGYSVLTPWIDRKLKVRDTCGVHNLHGMPAILAAAVSALMAGIATEDQYNQSLYQIFPAMAPLNATPSTEHTFIRPGLGRSAPEQAAYQIVALLVTLSIAIVAGLITGFVLRASTGISTENEYRDDISWIIHESNHLQDPASNTGKSHSASDETVQVASPIAGINSFPLQDTITAQ